MEHLPHEWNNRKMSSRPTATTFTTRLLTSALAAAVAVMFLASCSAEKQSEVASEPSTSGPKILMFYPGQPSVAPGDQAQFCYGVENAASVRLEPAVEDIRPLSNKCVWFKPEKTMELTLIARGTNGDETRETISIKVESGAPSSTRVAPGASQTGLIETFIATATTISRGGGSTICYVLREPATLTMNPSTGDLGTDLKKCVLVRPTETTRYTLTAKAGDKSDSVSVTVAVR